MLTQREEPVHAEVLLEALKDKRHDGTGARCHFLSYLWLSGSRLGN